MADYAADYGRVRVRPTVQLHLSYEWAEPPATGFTENVVTFEIGEHHVVDGIPRAGAEPS